MPRSLCRRYYGYLLEGVHKKCPKRCRFAHPEAVSVQSTQEYNRKLGFCYCGASLTTIVKHSIDRDADPTFFMVCGRTRKAIKRCKQ